MIGEAGTGSVGHFQRIKATAAAETPPAMAVISHAAAAALLPSHP